MAFLPFSPFFIIAGLIALSPRIPFLDRSRRLVVAAVFCVSLVGLCVLVWSGNSDHVVSAVIEGRYGLGVRLVLVYDQSALHFALLLVSAQIMILVSSYERVLGRSDSVFLLIGAGSAIISVAAASLWTLLITWGLIDLALYAYHSRRSVSEAERTSRQMLWVSVLSTLVLLMALVVAPEEAGRAPWKTTFVDETVRRLVLVAAWLRLAVYPLPGYARDQLTERLVQLCAGGCLWLRLINAQAIPADWQPALLGMATSALLCAALLSTDTSFHRSKGHVFSYGVAMLLLSPLLGTAEAGLVQTTTVFIIVGVTLWQAGQNLQDASVGGWAQAVQCLGFLTLLGIPLSLGFAGHGVLLARAVQSRSPNLVWIVTLAYMMFSWSIVRRIYASLRQIINQKSRRDVLWVGLVLLGFSMAQAMLLFIPWFRWGRLMGIGFSGEEPRNWVRVLVLTTIVPTLAAGAMLGWNPPSGLLVHTRSVVYWFFDLDWFYAALDRAVTQVQRFMRWLYEAIEEMVPLAWAMIWLLGIALYMFQR